MTAWKRKRKGKKGWIRHAICLLQATLITGICSIVLNLSHQCVRLCCSVCVFEGFCVTSESKVCFFQQD